MFKVVMGLDLVAGNAGKLVENAQDTSMLKVVMGLDFVAGKM